jgi:uncharacterized membrane protein YdbT with pleckstrin-like domain
MIQENRGDGWRRIKCLCVLANLTGKNSMQQLAYELPHHCSINTLKISAVPALIIIHCIVHTRCTYVFCVILTTVAVTPFLSTVLTNQAT